MLQLLQPLLPDQYPVQLFLPPGAPHEPFAVKQEVTFVHITGAYTEWLTLGLPVDICVPPPTKLPGNRSQHSCPICGDIKSSSDGAYNDVCLEHLGILLQCCFCTWSSGSVRMMQDHILKHHQKDDMDPAWSLGLSQCLIPPTSNFNWVVWQVPWCYISFVLFFYEG